MSFSYNKQSPNAAEAKTDLEASTLPMPVRDFMHAAIDATKFGERAVSVNCYGHLHDGAEGNYEVSSCTIDVHPVVVTLAEPAEERKLDTANSEAVMSPDDAAKKAGG